jgi:XRE family transcriptional regulator, regulator of sulfur utilization
MARSPKSAFGHLVGKSFGALLKEYRNKAQFSVQKLAIASQVDRKYIYQIEMGVSVPTLEVVFRLTDALALDCAEIVGRTRLLAVRDSRRRRPRRPLTPNGLADPTSE